jgi:hypothetical protein
MLRMLFLSAMRTGSLMLAPTTALKKVGVTRSSLWPYALVAGLTLAVLTGCGGDGGGGGYFTVLAGALPKQWYNVWAEEEHVT